MISENQTKIFYWFCEEERQTLVDRLRKVREDKEEKKEEKEKEMGSLKEKKGNEMSVEELQAI